MSRAQDTNAGPPGAKPVVPPSAPTPLGLLLASLRLRRSQAKRVKGTPLAPFVQPFVKGEGSQRRPVEEAPKRSGLLFQ